MTSLQQNTSCQNETREISLRRVLNNFEMDSIAQGIVCDIAWVSTDNNAPDRAHYANVKVILEHDGERPRERYYQRHFETSFHIS